MARNGFRNQIKQRQHFNTANFDLNRSYSTVQLDRASFALLQITTKNFFADLSYV